MVGKGKNIGSDGAFLIRQPSIARAGKCFDEVTQRLFFEHPSYVEVRWHVELVPRTGGANHHHLCRARLPRSLRISAVAELR